jgi:prolyl-tRNA synthetase
MKQSVLFTKTKKTLPKDEVSLNAKLLLQAGFIDKEMAGVYSFLPLGLRVFKKIEQIIRNEMNAIGGQEITMTALQNPAVWQTTKRWDDDVIDVWFKTKLKNGTEVGLATTHEEPLTNLMTQFISSYKDLPFYVYQFQTKFRNEVRSKSGIMRTREFVMKDLYSFNRTQAEMDVFYDQAAEAYKKIFNQVGIGDKTYYTFASGGSFSKYSHEFQTISDSGEDIIHIHDGKKIAINKEVYTDEVLADLGIKREELREEKSIEVGNIFKLGTRFSDALNLHYTDQDGAKQPVTMGSYGIGPARLMGTVVELNSDEKGIVWPEAIAPFKVHLISLNQNEEADKLYNKLLQSGVEVLYDDRDMRAGEKFSDADLIGCPIRVVVSDKTLKEGCVEIKSRKSAEAKLEKIEAFLASL